MRRNRTGDFGAQALCLGFGFGSCHSFQRAGKDDGFAGKRRIVVCVVDEVFNRYFFKQAIDGADVVFFIEKLDHVFGHGFADAVNREQTLGVLIAHVGHEIAETSVVSGYQPGRCGADLSDAQSIDKARQFNAALGADGAKQVFNRFFAPAVAAFQMQRLVVDDGKQVFYRAAAAVPFFQSEDVGRVAENPFVVKLFDDFAAQPFNVKGFARNKVFQPLNGLCRAGQAAGTAADGFVFFPNGMGAAFGADGRKFEFGRIRPTLLLQDFDNLRNDVARPLNDDVIVDADVFAFDFVFVMKGGVRNNDAADIDRFQIGNRSQRAGAADLNTDVVDTRNRFSAGNLCAIAQRGVRVRKPNRSCREMALTL